MARGDSAHPGGAKGFARLCDSVGQGRPVSAQGLFRTPRPRDTSASVPERQLTASRTTFHCDVTATGLAASTTQNGALAVPGRGDKARALCPSLCLCLCLSPVQSLRNENDLVHF